MIVLFVGDPCSGKSSILQRLQKEGYSVVLEKGWEQISEEVEKNKLESNYWFCDYYYQRDLQALKENSENKIILFERLLPYQYVLSDAQFFVKKITQEDHLKINSYIDALLSDYNLSDIVTLHFTTDYTNIIERLKERNIHKDERQIPYWNYIRTRTQEYFSELGTYKKINTSGRDLDNVYAEILSFLTSLN